MYRDNYIKSLRKEMLDIVAQQLSPISLKYGYSDVPLETTIKWRPQVLILGNYSSGKSTLINDFLGAPIQATGQAPTDDSFTIITYDGGASPDLPVQVTETRDGKVLLNDPEYPFEILKKHGQRFASHFKLKKVNSPFLKNLALIDTPGMLDSMTERDRGYNYQEVIGDFAQIADLVLVLFDPHKAGTVREAHTSLRDTLPSRTFEDRVLFVLNRIDECASLIDLLRVYGTLCWNLSQITGRKDIPMIHLTYSPQNAAAEPEQSSQNYLPMLANQREELKKAVELAPHYRLDNMAAYIETHSQRISHFLEGLIVFRKKARQLMFKSWIGGIVVAVIIGALAFSSVISTPFFSGFNLWMDLAIGLVVTVAAAMIWNVSINRLLFGRLFKKTLKKIDVLTELSNQTRRDSWEMVRSLVVGRLKETGGRYALKEVRKEYAIAWGAYEKGSQEIREALKELETLSQARNTAAADSESDPTDDEIFRQEKV